MSATNPNLSAGLSSNESSRGLSEVIAARRLAEEGFNVLPEPLPASAVGLFIRQFANVMIGVLAGAALLSGWLGEWVDLAPEAWFGALVASLLPVPLHEWLKKRQ